MKWKKWKKRRNVVNNHSDIGEVKDSEEDKVTNENCLTDKISFNSNDIKDNSSTPKESKDEIKKSKSKEDGLSCKICKYVKGKIP